MRITLKNTRKLLMKNFNKLLIALLVGSVISGCSSTPSRSDDCEQITITAYLPPVVADLDYQDLRGSQNQVIVQGGFQHVLAIPGRKKVLEQALTPPLQFTNDASAETETVFFEFDLASLPPSGENKLNSFLQRIHLTKLLHIQVEGHTDAIGSAQYNHALSIKRAKTIRDYLVQHGIQASKITIEGFGKSLPLEPNNSEAGRAKNRRAVIIPLTGYSS